MQFRYQLGDTSVSTPKAALVLVAYYPKTGPACKKCHVISYQADSIKLSTARCNAPVDFTAEHYAPIDLKY